MNFGPAPGLDSRFANRRSAATTGLISACTFIQSFSCIASIAAPGIAWNISGPIERVEWGPARRCRSESQRRTFGYITSIHASTNAWDAVACCTISFASASVAT